MLFTKRKKKEKKNDRTKTTSKGYLDILLGDWFVFKPV